MEKLVIFLILVIIYEVATGSPRRGKYNSARVAVPTLPDPEAADSVRFASAARSAEADARAPTSSTWAASYYLRDNEDMRLKRMGVNPSELTL